MGGPHGPRLPYICTLDGAKVGKYRDKAQAHLIDAHQGKPFTAPHVGKVLPTANKEELTREFGEEAQLWYINEQIRREEDLLQRKPYTGAAAVTSNSANLKVSATSGTSSAAAAWPTVTFTPSEGPSTLEALHISEKADWIVLTAVLVKDTTENGAREAAHRPGVQPALILQVKALKVEDLAISQVTARMETWER